jgi:hypothetical protein
VARLLVTLGLALLAAYAAILVALTLRAVVRRAGLRRVREQWPGTDDGFAALARLAGLRAPAPT